MLFINTLLLLVKVISELLSKNQKIVGKTVMDILNKKVTKEKGLSEYRQELEIIKKGLLR